MGPAPRDGFTIMRPTPLCRALEPHLSLADTRSGPGGTLARRTGRTRSQIVREALRRHLAAAQLDDLRRRVMPFAEAAGYLTDEDIFQNIS